MEIIRKVTDDGISHIIIKQEETGRLPIYMSKIPKHDGSRYDEIMISLIDSIERPGIYVSVRNLKTFIVALQELEQIGVPDINIAKYTMR